MAIRTFDLSERLRHEHDFLERGVDFLKAVSFDHLDQASRERIADVDRIHERLIQARAFDQQKQLLLDQVLLVCLQHAPLVFDDRFDQVNAVVVQQRVVAHLLLEQLEADGEADQRVVLLEIFEELQRVLLVEIARRWIERAEHGSDHALEEFVAEHDRLLRELFRSLERNGESSREEDSTGVRIPVHRTARSSS